MQQLTRITTRLAERGVDFIIAGGLGTLIHGGAQMTRDVDIVCPMTPANLTRLFEAIEELHPNHRMTPDRLPFARDQAGQGRLKNLYLTTDWGQLDCLGEIKGLGGYDDCLPQSEIIVLGQVRVRVLTLDALIAAKRAMARPRDLHAVLELEAIRDKRSREPRR